MEVLIMIYAIHSENSLWTGCLFIHHKMTAQNYKRLQMAANV